MMRYAIITILCFSSLFLGACSGSINASDKEGDYDATKKMVVDILQTEEGKKALVEIMADEKIKQELVIQSDVVKSAINETLVSDKGKEMWSTLFKDPQFVEGYAKSLNEEHIKLMKELMGDPDYQGKLIDLLNDPKVTEQMLTVMKSQDFRSHLQNTITETLESPLYQAQIQEILLKAAQEQGQGQEQGGQDGQSGGTQGGNGGDGQGQGGGTKKSGG